MTDTLRVAVGEKLFGSFYARQERKLEISDKKLTLLTKLDGTWPGSWNKKDITITRNLWFWSFIVTPKDPAAKRVVVSTYTNRVYFFGVLPYAIISLLALFGLLARYQHTLNTFYGFGVLLIFLCSALAQYPSFRKLSRALKKHGYL